MHYDVQQSLMLAAITPSRMAEKLVRQLLWYALVSLHVSCIATVCTMLCSTIDVRKSISANSQQCYYDMPASSARSSSSQLEVSVPASTAAAPPLPASGSAGGGCSTTAPLSSSFADTAVAK